MSQKRKDDTWTKSELTDELAKQRDSSRSRKKHSSTNPDKEVKDEKTRKDRSHRKSTGDQLGKSETQNEDHHRSKDEHRSREDRRSKEERRSKDEHRPKDEHRSKDDRRSKDKHRSKDEHISKEDRRTRDEHRSKDDRRAKDEHRSKDKRSKDERRSKDEHRSKDDRRSKDEHRSREDRKYKDEHRSTDEHRSKEDRRSKDERRKSRRDEDVTKSRERSRKDGDHRRERDDRKHKVEKPGNIKEESHHRDDYNDALLQKKSSRTEKLANEDDTGIKKSSSREGKDRNRDNKIQKHDSSSGSKTEKKSSRHRLDEKETVVAESRSRIEKKSTRHRLDEEEEAPPVKENRSKAVEKIASAHEPPAPSKQEEEDYNYDEDDFEDYEDDFEEDDDDSDVTETFEEVKQSSGMNAIIRAIDAENERIMSSGRSGTSLEQSSSEYSASTTISPSSSHIKHSRSSTTSSAVAFTSHINFTGAKQRSRANTNRNKLLKRRNDLMPLIQLDVNSFDLFELKPVTEYGFYMKNFGSTNSRQVATQCNEDNLTVDIQTDEIESVEKWSQHPAEGAVSCGGIRHVEAGSGESDKISQIKSIFGGDSGRFVQFIRYSSRLIDVMLTEASVWGETVNGQNSDIRVCENYTRYNKNLDLHYTKDRQIVSCDYVAGVIIISMSPKSSIDDDKLEKFDENGLITIWKSANEHQPHKILVCDGTPKVHCYSAKKEILFLGTDEGCVLAYDLKEPSSMHYITEETIVFRFPTYTTGWMKNVHQSPIVALDAIGKLQKSNQIFSVDESGLICVWVVVEMLSNVDDDVGLVPYGNIKLVPSLTTHTSKNKNDDVMATCAVCPDTNTFFIGTDTGEVRSRSRDRHLKIYSDASHVCDVINISFNPFISWLMLVGYGNGTVSLFNIKLANPVMTWCLEANKMKYSSWSNCRPSVFFSFDSDNFLHTFDLMAIDTSPAVSDRIQRPVATICMNKNKKHTTDLMLAYEDGMIESHRVVASFCHWTATTGNDEKQQFIQLLTSFAR